jgi:hypothetical protein
MTSRCEFDSGKGGFTQIAPGTVSVAMRWLKLLCERTCTCDDHFHMTLILRIVGLRFRELWLVTREPRVFLAELSSDSEVIVASNLRAVESYYLKPLLSGSF